MEQKEKIRYDLLWLILFALAFIMLIYKCKFGFASSDECFYYQTPLRMINGEGMFSDDWNISMLSSALLYPLVKLYFFIFNSMDGFFLVFRHVFTVFHATICAVIYFRLREKGIAAVISSLVCLLYVPYGIMALSYNSMGLDFMLLSCILMYTNEKNGVVYFFAGVFFAGAVLCCPYLIVLYLLYSVCCLWTCLTRDTGGLLRDILPYKSFLPFTLACVTCAVIYLKLLVFSRCTLKDVFEALPFILYDPGHLPRSIGYIIKAYVTTILNSGKHLMGVSVFWLCLALMIVILLDKRRMRRKELYCAIAFVLTLIYIVPFWTFKKYINFLMYPLNIWGIFCFVLSNYKYKREMLFLWIPGMLYGVCLNFSSNQEFYVTCNAATISTVGSVIIIIEFCYNICKEMKSSRQKRRKNVGYVAYGILVLFFILFLCKEVEMRYNSLYWEDVQDVSTMTACIDQGIEKGIWVTQERKDEYNSVMQDTEVVRNAPGDVVLYYTTHQWLYLTDARKWGALVTWHSPEMGAINHLMQYYKLQLDNIPDIVYCEKGDYEIIIPYLMNVAEYTVSETELGYLLTRINEM